MDLWSFIKTHPRPCPLLLYFPHCRFFRRIIILSWNKSIFSSHVFAKRVYFFWFCNFQEPALSAVSSTVALLCNVSSTTANVMHRIIYSHNIMRSIIHNRSMLHKNIIRKKKNRSIVRMFSMIHSLWTCRERIKRCLRLDFNLAAVNMRLLCF